MYNDCIYSIRKSMVHHTTHGIYILLQVVSQRLIDRDPEEDSTGGPLGFGGRTHGLLVQKKKTEIVYGIH